MKKILIIGPIGDFGGRELEAGFIAKSLMDDFDVTICSTDNLTEKSQVFDFVKKEQVISLKNLTLEHNVILRITSFLSYIKNRGKQPLSFYINSKLNKKYFNVNKKLKIHLKNVINNTDLVFICAHIFSNYIEEIINYSHTSNKPIIFRTTGKIKTINQKEFQFFKKVNTFIHHSEKNANNLNSQICLPYVVIDQCAFNEGRLLNNGPISEIKKLLFIGRLSDEKGIIELVSYCSRIENITLDIIGDGGLMQKLKNSVNLFNNINFLGFKNQNEIIKYIKESDVIVISSKEESGPLTGIEALAASRVIISTRVGAMEERLNGLKNQFWFSIEDFNSFSNLIKILKQLEKQELFDICTQNRIRYIQRFSKLSVSKQYVSLAKSLLN